MQTLIERAMLVYQCGIANVFAVKSFDLNVATREEPVRLMQSDFRTCEAFARGMSVAGTSVRSAHCNMAGDIALQDWSLDLDDAPFRDQMRPVAI
jgi:hypothetical protein